MVPQVMVRTGGGTGNQEKGRKREIAAKLWAGLLAAVVLAGLCGEIKGEPDPHKPYEPEYPKAEGGWAEVTSGLHGSVGSIYRRYEQRMLPDANGSMDLKMTGWRGERVNGQLVLWTRQGAEQVRVRIEDLEGPGGETIAGSVVKCRFVRYVLGDGKLMPDVLDDAERVEMAEKSVRPVWITVEVPRDCKPGTYDGKISVVSKNGSELAFDLTLEVLDMELEEPAQWAFHLDLWQNPYSVARWHHVDCWSAEHLTVLEKYLRMLGEAGQKCITTSIVPQPWGGQTYDAFDSMIKWVKKKDSRWSYDYSAFDKYVELCERCGIAEQINCYSMVPWTNRFGYFDESSGNYAYIEAKPGSKAFEEHWQDFLEDFAGHLRKKGWLERTTIAMDERPVPMMEELLDFLHSTAEEYKVTLAAGYDDEDIIMQVYDYCVHIRNTLDSELIDKRRKDGMVTTFYVCCGPPRPNTFPASRPGEASWLGWHAAARGYSGFLRWAYNSWVADPLYDTSHVKWTAGDCFMIYPGPRSSIRFEMLRDGIEDYEKIRAVRNKIKQLNSGDKKDAMAKLQKVLGGFEYTKDADYDYTGELKAARRELRGVSRQLAAMAHRKSAK